MLKIKFAFLLSVGVFVAVIWVVRQPVEMLHDCPNKDCEGDFL